MGEVLSRMDPRYFCAFFLEGSPSTCLAGVLTSEVSNPEGGIEGVGEKINQRRQGDAQGLYTRRLGILHNLPGSCFRRRERHNEGYANAQA